MGFQSLVVLVVVGCCAAYVVRSLLRKVLAGSSEGGCSGCGGCGSAAPKACAQPMVFQPPKPK